MLHVVEIHAKLLVSKFTYILKNVLYIRGVYWRILSRRQLSVALVSEYVKIFNMFVYIKKMIGDILFIGSTISGGRCYFFQ